MSTNHARFAPSPIEIAADDDVAQLNALIADRAQALRRLAALARAQKSTLLTAEEIEFATALGREAAMAYEPLCDETTPQRRAS